MTREVLPGVGTVLEFDLKPLLAAGVEASVSTNLVLIRAGLGGSAICTNGLIARPGGLVLTTLSALPATQGLEVVANSGQVYSGLSVAASDQARDLAVLRLEGSVMSPQPSAPSASNRPYAWSVYHPQCGAVTSTRTRLAAGIAASLAPTLPADARGAPLVDRNGALIGIVMGPALFAPLALADGILAQAAAPVVATVEPPQVAVSRGGFPIGWVGAGAALVGLGAFLLTGGDEGGGDTVGGGTGTIVITIPGN